MWVNIFRMCMFTSNVPSVCMYTGIVLQHVNAKDLMCPFMLTFPHCACVSVHAFTARGSQAG